MKFLKLVIAAGAVAVLGLTAVPSLAQGPGGHGGPGGQGGHRPDMVARMTQELNLTSAQQTKIRAIVQDFRQKFEGMRGNPNARGVMQEFRAKVEAVLTPEQKKKFEAMGGMMGGPGGRMQGVLNQLDLNASQKHKINLIMDEMRKKMQAIPEDQRREQMRPLMETYRAKIEAVLTPSQKQKFETLMEQGRRGGGPRGGGAA